MWWGGWERKGEGKEGNESCVATGHRVKQILTDTTMIHLYSGVYTSTPLTSL